MDIHFQCTQCGLCCHDLRLVLSIEEARVWAGRGHMTQLLVQAVPDANVDDSGDANAIFDYRRSFPAVSGSMPIRIVATLVGYHVGPCPNLRADMRCGIYAERPRICRIYPLNRRQGDPFDTVRKVCPPEAWSPDNPVLMRGTAIADPLAATIIDDHHAAAIADTPKLTAVCERLGFREAAFSNEGMAVCTLEPDDLLAALDATGSPGARQTEWTIVTNRQATLAMLHATGCKAAAVSRGPGYLGTFPDEIDQ